LARQEQRESNARIYPRHFPFAVAEASGSVIRDLDGNVFIDFLAVAGVLSLGHNHPELVAAATEQMGLFAHELGMPSLAKDDFTTAQLSMLTAFLSEHVMKLPTSDSRSSRGGKICQGLDSRSG
jgi:diaminobutyrate-2-oxoglutarate transaminase